MQVNIDPEKIKQFFQSYTDDSKALALMQERLSSLEAKTGSPRTSSLTGMPGGGGSPVDTIGRQVSTLEVLRDAVADAEAQLERKRQQVEAVITLLRENRVSKWPEKTNTLQLRFVDGLSWNDTAEIVFGADPDFWDCPERYRARLLAYQRQALQELAELCPPELIDDYEIKESGS